MAKQDTLILELVSNANEEFWHFYCTTNTTASDKPGRKTNFVM